MRSRSCIIGMRIAEELRLPSRDCSDLYYALLLKDSGCSSNAARMHCILGSDEIQAKREVKFVDWTKITAPGLGLGVPQYPARQAPLAAPEAHGSIGGGTQTEQRTAHRRALRTWCRHCPHDRAQ